MSEENKGTRHFSKFIPFEKLFEKSNNKMQCNAGRKFDLRVTGDSS
jgi:hypothetical protein